MPYKGSALASAALVGGEIVMGFSNAIATLPRVRAGRLKILGLRRPYPLPARGIGLALD